MTQYDISMLGMGGNLPTPFSLIKVWALVLAAADMVGEGAAKEPKRRVKMEEMVAVLTGSLI